jgi:Xaa-Pro dipeptidase
MNEIQSKLQKVRTFLAQRKLAGAVFNTQTNFSWITGGKDAHVAMGSENAVAGILVTKRNAYLLTDTIEEPRIYAEEILKRQFPPLIFPWYEREKASQLIKKVCGKGSVVSDTGSYGTKNLSSDLARLRWQLLPEELKRYREVGTIASNALESVCFAIKPGISEFEISGTLAASVISQGALPFVVLIATDERIARFRHPPPQPKKLKRYAMLVVCAKKYGLIANATRLVHFGKLPSELRKKHEAVCQVDVAFNLATQPGVKACDVLREGIAAYEAQGFKKEWTLHHQGGATGYAGREWFGTPTSKEVILENQAFAWNPSITGTKSEDTIFVSRDGMEVITPTSKKWPMVHFHHPDGCIERPDILVR